MPSVRPRFFVLAVALTLLVCAGPASLAQACVETGCEPPLRLFYEPEVPANLIYFEVLKSDPGPLTLHVTDGRVVATSIQMVGSDRVFAPTEPIAAGTDLTLDYVDGCRKPQTLRFVAGAASDVQLVTPGLGVRSSGFMPGSEIKTSQVVLEYVDGDELGSARHLRDVSATLDGSDFNGVRAGEDRLRFVIQAYCDGSFGESSCGGDFSVDRGEHELVVTTRYVGQPAVETVMAKVNMRCSGKGGRAVELPSRSPLPFDPLAEEQATDDGGCSLGSRPGSSWTLLSLVLLLLLLLFRRRHKTQV